MSGGASLDPSLREGLPPDAAACAGAIDALVPQRVLAQSRTTECAVVVLPGGARLVRKRWRWPRLRDRVKGAFRTTVAAKSPARREFEAFLRLGALPSGKFAPRPLGFFEERRRGVLLSCILLAEEIEGATDLATFLRDSRDAALRRRVLADLGGRTRAMHDAGLRDGEHHPRNVLVLPPQARTLRVDCAKQSVSRNPVRGDRAFGDLAAIDVALARFGTEEERCTLVRSWLGPGSGEAALEHAMDRLEALRPALERRESARLPPQPTTP